MCRPTTVQTQNNNEGPPSNTKPYRTQLDQQVVTSTNNTGITTTTLDSAHAHNQPRSLPTFSEPVLFNPHKYTLLASLRINPPILRNDSRGVGRIPTPTATQQFTKTRSLSAGYHHKSGPRTQLVSMTGHQMKSSLPTVAENIKQTKQTQWQNIRKSFICFIMISNKLRHIGTKFCRYKHGQTHWSMLTTTTGLRTESIPTWR